MTTKFGQSYEECRDLFLRATEAYPERELRSVPIKDLFIDIVFIPSQNPSQKLVILSSGLHGVEGYLGSALQTDFLKKLPHEDAHFLFFHGINPYGFKHGLRVTENNVDLNRHLSTSLDLFETKNRAYDEIDGFLNPQVPARLGLRDKLAFYLSAGKLIARSSLDTVRRGMLAGQYTKADGIFFGGQHPEPQREILLTQLEFYGDRFSQVLHLDLHTGYGKRGKLHVLAGDREPASPFDEHIFRGISVEYGQEEDFYEISGGFIDFTRSLFSTQGKDFAGAYLEFGTLDGDTLLGNLEMAYRMIRENQYRRFGGEGRVSEQFKEMFFPSSPQWRSQCVTQFHQTMGQLMQNLSRTFFL